MSAAANGAHLDYAETLSWLRDQMFRPFGIPAELLEQEDRGMSVSRDAEQRRAFERALEADPDDEATRMVFADFLDEQGDHEESDRHRRWKAAKAWLVDFAERCGETCENYGEGSGWSEEADEQERWRKVTFEDVIQAGRDRLAPPGDWWAGFTQMGSEKARDLMFDGETRALYWRHWSTVTGAPVPGAMLEESPFSCSC
jgi:uncharacterized protein (TIGR02996 family)